MTLDADAMAKWRRWAVMLAQHAGRVLLGARSNQTAVNPTAVSWGEAMRRELDYIEDDRTALRWALGCVVASYKARLAAGPGFIASMSMRNVLRHVAACGTVMLVIGFALLENAESQTEPPRPAADETACDQTGPPGASGPTRNAAPVARTADPGPETSCAGGNAPGRTLPKDQTR
jgi:hypothetical protein